MQRFLENEEQSPVAVETGDTPRFVRRIKADHSQSLRRSVQLLFLALNVWIGIQFVLFVRYFESGGKSIYISRPPGVEGWLPISGLMNLKYFLATGSIPSIHPAAMFLLVAFLLISIFFRKAFCGWLCPIGLISEALWKFGKKLLKWNWDLPRSVDVPLRSLKYILLALFVYAVGGLSAAAIDAFQSSPYGLVADIKMLHFFEFLTATAAITLVALSVLSIFVKNFWCRYLCPYGALVGLASVFSPAKVFRDTERCIDCAKCTQACPALLKVDHLITVRSAECTGCMECVAVCPAEGALQMSFGRKYRLAPWILAAGLAVVFLGITAYAKWNGTWRSRIPDSVYQQLIPQLDSLQHP
jgi:polyferredoxin